MPHPAPPPEPGPSRTAVGVALQRAAHLLLDDPPPILDDPVAAALVGPEALAALAAAPARFRSPEARARRAHVVARGRFAEDRLRAAVERGTRQYGVLGAGFDTFAYRQPPWAAGVRVVEVDHPASQRAKRARLAAAGIPVPPNVTYAAVDLEAVPTAAALTDALAAHGVRPDAPAFVGWLGVTMYLSAAAVDAGFRAAAAMPPGSEIAFTFAPPPPPGVDPADWPSPAHRAATAGEPWRTFFTADALAAALRALGFASVDFLGPDEAEARYFRGRRDGLAAPDDVTIGAAVV